MHRGLIAIASLLLACSDSPEPTEQPAAPEPEAKAEAPAKEPAAEEEIAVEDVDTPTADPQLAIGITVLHATKTKQPLAAATEVGVARPLDVVFSATKREGKNRTLLFPTVRIDATHTRNAPGSSTLAIEGVHLGEGPGADATAVTAMAKEATAGTVAVTSDELGAVAPLGWPATTTAPGAPDLAATARLALAHVSIPVPSEAIGGGSKWAVKRPIEVYGVKALETIHVKLVRIYGAQIEITGKITYELDPEAAPVTVLDLANVNGLKGNGSVFARLHLPSGLPIEMHVQSELTFGSTGADGKTDTRTIDMDARVDEDFLAVADKRVKFKGRFAQGGLIHGIVAPGTKVWLDKERVRLSDTGDFLIAFGRDADARARIGFQFPGGEIERHIVHVQAREFLPEKIDGLPPEMVDYDNETERELAKSRKQVNKIRGKESDHTFFRQGWRWPVKGRVTSTYGRKRILNGKERGIHWGLDIAAPVGQKVRAPAPGVVVFAQEGVPLSGTLLIIDHGHGLTSSFLHLSKITVQVGQTVKAGQVIAKTGNSGRTTGPHLDWRMNLEETRIDPQLLLRGKT